MNPVFWAAKRQPTTSTALDLLFGMPEKDQRETAERMVQTGEWQPSEAEEAIRLAHRLEAFVAADPKRG